MKKTTFAVFLSLIWTSFVVEAQEKPCSNLSTSVYVAGGFQNGEQYLKMTARDQSMYTMGALNGMLIAALFGAPEKCTKWLENYTKGMSAQQLAAIITKHLNDNPGDWHLPLNVETYNAIHDAYRKEYPESDK